MGIWTFLFGKSKRKYCSDGQPHQIQVFSNDDSTWKCTRCGTGVFRVGIFDLRFIYRKLSENEEDVNGRMES